ncbi:P-loop containing nucleoside triphosphate hydrolase [Gracilaria domingensis]|nr:P-loop containing nucleoside triphosphate hydrolase [Gracilaria domingensis]
MQVGHQVEETPGFEGPEKDTEPGSAHDFSPSEPVARNVYLLGETGEGKSTLANDLTGTERFRVSHSGTGTTDISCGMLKYGEDSHNINVWDTPGMNDQGNLDSRYARILEQTLAENKTVSAVVVVSKDGSRVPKTLKMAISAFRKLFGESFMCSICVCIGINEKKTAAQTLEAKRSFWKQRVLKYLDYELPTDRIFFYNATDRERQPQAEKIRTWLLNQSIYLVGEGKTIAEAIIQVRNNQVTPHAKEGLQIATFAALRSLKTLVETHKVQRKTCLNSKEYRGFLELFLGPESEPNAVSTGRKEITVEVLISSSGKEASELLQRTAKKISGLKEKKSVLFRKGRIFGFVDEVRTKKFIFIEKTVGQTEQGQRSITMRHFVLMGWKSDVSEEVMQYANLVLDEVGLKKSRTK